MQSWLFGKFEKEIPIYYLKIDWDTVGFSSKSENSFSKSTATILLSLPFPMHWAKIERIFWLSLERTYLY